MAVMGQGDVGPLLVVRVLEVLAGYVVDSGCLVVWDCSFVLTDAVGVRLVGIDACSMVLNKVGTA